MCVKGGLKIWITISFRVSSAKSSSSINKTTKSDEEELSYFFVPDYTKADFFLYFCCYWKLYLLDWLLFFFIILLTTFSIRPWRCFQITIRPLKPNSMLPESLRKERTFDLRPNQNDRLISEYLLWSWKWLFPFGAWGSSRSASSEKISMYLTRHLLPARIGSNACLAWLSHWD